MLPCRFELLCPIDMELAEYFDHSFTHDDRVRVPCAVLRTLSTSVLAELVQDMERRIGLYSESLVEELARRDELDFAKEQRNQFIWLLLRVQKRRHQFAQLHRQQHQQHDDSCQQLNTGVGHSLSPLEEMIFEIILRPLVAWL